jgi:hypothetical protein
MDRSPIEITAEPSRFTSCKRLKLTIRGDVVSIVAYTTNDAAGKAFQVIQLVICYFKNLIAAL